jgi:hypothetical protein
MKLTHGYGEPKRGRLLRGHGLTAWLPARLFRNNEPGIVLDPSAVADMSWRRNLLTWSEDFGNAAWVKSNVSVLPNAAVSPDGKQTASKLSSTGFIYNRSPSGSPNQQVTGSIWVKGASGVTSITLRIDRDGVAQGNQVIYPVSDTAWTRLVHTATLDAGSQPPVFRMDLSGGHVYVWHPQLELGSTATEYQKITDVHTEVRERFPKASLFQDSAGTQPVASPGDPVGLALDTSKGLVLGPELTATITGPGNGTNTITDLGDNTFRWQGDGSNFTAIRFDTSEVGKSYLIEPEVISRVSGDVKGNDVSDSSLYSTIRPGVSPIICHKSQKIEFGRKVSNEAIDITIKFRVRHLPGHHATQPTASKRPIYGYHPKRGRVNLLTHTEDFGHSDWLKSSGTTVAPLGEGVARITASEASGYVEQLIPFIQGQTRVFAVDVRAESGTVAGNIEISGTVIESFSAGSAWQRVETAWLDPESGIYRPRIRLTNAGTSIEVRYPQLEKGPTATDYQRVTTKYDVTEPGQPLVHYLAFDGVDDFLSTGNIDFTSTDEMMVVAGARKLSDATTGMLVELSDSTSTTANTGSFHLASAYSNSSNWQPSLRGSSGRVAQTLSPFASPISGILTMEMDIAAVEELTCRVDGREPTTGSIGDATAGAGNFGNYPLYIGMRGGTSLPFNGNLYGLLIRGKTPTDTELGRSERHLASKTGVTLP